MPHPYQVRHLFYSLWLFRVLGGAAFADHADLDLAGVIQLVLDLFGNLAGQQDDLIITNLIRLDQDADLAACLHGVRAFNAPGRAALIASAAIIMKASTVLGSTSPWWASIA